MLVSHINKKFGDHTVLKDISFELKRGEIIGLIGRNGAGKSTLMKIITQNIISFEGKVEGNDRLGYLIESPKLYENRTGYYNINYFAKLFNQNFDFDVLSELLIRLELKSAINKKVKTYSLGMKQKLGLVNSLLNNPHYLILDEPTNGMDIETSQIILEELKGLALKKNIGILISSHKLEDIEQICSQVLHIQEGKISSQQTMQEISKQYVIIQFPNEAATQKFILHQSAGIIIKQIDNVIYLDSPKKLGEIITFLNEKSISVDDIRIEKNDLRKSYLTENRG